MYISIDEEFESSYFFESSMDLKLKHQQNLQQQESHYQPRFLYFSSFNPPLSLFNIAENPVMNWEYTPQYYTNLTVKKPKTNTIFFI